MEIFEGQQNLLKTIHINEFVVYVHNTGMNLI